ncbi:S-layer homology domain-containing protein, partial [Paenibacillus hemerocallicola]
GGGNNGGGNNGGGNSGIVGKPIEAVGGKADIAELRKAFEASSTVEVRFPGNTLEVSAAAWPDTARANGGALVVSGEHGAYRFPAPVWKPEQWAAELGTEASEITLRFTMAKLDGSEAEQAGSTVQAAGGKQLSDAVHFEVEAVRADGKSVPVSFGSVYAAREISTNRSVDPSKATGVQVLPDSRQIRFVPTVFRTENGVTTASLKRNGNSIYTIVQNDKSFADMAGHWAQADVTLLANKLVIDGVSETRFDPDRGITRAEFASLLVRSLGLSPVAASARFSDVASGAWYALDVATAASAGLIGGFEDGSFRPDQSVKREEQAAMLVRALSYAGFDIGVSESKQAEILGRFRDTASLSWARKDLAAAINAGLIDGMTGNTLEAQGLATRAQSAAMLKRLLVKADFID